MAAAPWPSGRDRRVVTRPRTTTRWPASSRWRRWRCCRPTTGGSSSAEEAPHGRAGGAASPRKARADHAGDEPALDSSASGSPARCAPTSGPRSTTLGLEPLAAEPGNVLLMYLTPAQQAELRRQPFVAGLEPYGFEASVTPELLDAVKAARAAELGKPEAGLLADGEPADEVPDTYDVICQQPDDVALVGSIIATTAGTEILGTSDIMVRVKLTLDPAALQAFLAGLAGLPQVAKVSPYETPTLYCRPQPPADRRRAGERGRRHPVDGRGRDRRHLRQRRRRHPPRPRRPDRRQRDPAGGGRGRRGRARHPRRRAGRRDGEGVRREGHRRGAGGQAGRVRGRRGRREAGAAARPGPAPRSMRSRPGPRSSTSAGASRCPGRTRATR